MRTAFFSASVVAGLILNLIPASIPASAANLASPTAAVSKLQSSPKMLTATGEGAMPTVKEQPNRAKAYLQAKSYAQAQAVANLILEARGTNVNYRATGKGYVMDEQMSQEITGMVEHVQMVSERRVQIGKDTVVEVKVQAPMPERLRKPPTKQVAAKSGAGPSWMVASTVPIAPSSNSFRRAKEAAYTSVVIDALGLGVTRAMSPKILRRDGSEVWGTLKVDFDFLADHGIVAYARTLGEAYTNSRAGDNPLVLRAKQRGACPYRCDVVLSDDDADYLISENRRSAFLSDFRVIFLVDGRR